MARTHPYDDQAGAYISQQQNTPRNTQPQNQLQYTPSFNFHASQGPTQGKLSFGGKVAQVAARVMGGIAARNGDRNMIDIADGIGGIGEIASRTNDTQDRWGRFPGNPEYGKKPRNQQNVGPQQQNYGQKRPYQNAKPPYQPLQNNRVQPPMVNPVPPVIPVHPAAVPPQPAPLPNVLPNIPTGQKIQDGIQDKVDATEKKQEKPD